MLASCKIGKNYRGTEVPVSEEFRFADTLADIPEVLLVNPDSLGNDSVLAYDWFSLFGDATLDSLVQQALEKNQDLKIAAENIAQAQYGLTVQRSEMLPQISYEAGATRGNFLNGLQPQEQTFLYGYGFVNWELDFWGKFRRLNEAAKANIVAREEGYRAVQISLVATVAQSYFQLLEYRNRLAVAEATVALRDSMLGIIEMRFEKGIIPEIDLNQAQVQLAIAEAEVPLWQRLSAQTEHLLSVLAGDIPQGLKGGQPISAVALPAMLPPDQPLSLLSRRPDVLAAEQELIAQNARVGAAQANRLPSISLSGLLGTAGGSLSDLGTAEAWNLGGSLLGPLFFFNRFKRLADIEKSRREQAQLAYERTVLNALRETEDALVAIQTLKEELIARQAHVRAALNAQKLSQARYIEGATSYLEFLESQRQAFQAQQNLAGTQQQLLSAYAQLYKALGGGWNL